jgi:hypothetical protein
MPSVGFGALHDKRDNITGYLHFHHYWAPHFIIHVVLELLSVDSFIRNTGSPLPTAFVTDVVGLSMRDAHTRLHVLPTSLNSRRSRPNSFLPLL